MDCISPSRICPARAGGMHCNIVGEGLVPSRIWAGINPAPTFFVIPAKAGIQFFFYVIPDLIGNLFF
jgi:hypothetical protein